MPVMPSAASVAARLRGERYIRQGMHARNHFLHSSFKLNGLLSLEKGKCQ